MQFVFSQLHINTFYQSTTGNQPKAFLPYSTMISGFLYGVEISSEDLPHVTSCANQPIK